MIKHLFRLLSVVVVILLGACSLMPEQPPTAIVLFRASIDDIRDGPPYPKSTKPNVIDFTSYFFVDYDLHETLIGHLKHQRGAALTAAWHMPISDREPPLQFYILARQDNEGKMRTIWWAQVRSGFCLSQKFASELGIEHQMQALYQSGDLACKEWMKLGYALKGNQ